MGSRDFRKLRLYRFALQAVTATHVAFKELEEPTPGLINDLTAAARQVCSRIAGAHVHRHSLEFCLELIEEAMSKAAETLMLLDLAHRLGHLTQERREPLANAYRRLLRRLERLAAGRRTYDDDSFGSPGFGDGDED